MSIIPEIQYARSDDSWIAYHVMGTGSIDLVATSGYALPIEEYFKEPSARMFYERLGSFARVIRYDRRGTGLSDPVSSSAPLTLEQWVTDGLSVLDAVGSEQAALVAMDEGAGQVMTLFAATHRSRVSALVLVNPRPSPLSRPDWPYGPARDLLDELLDQTESQWLTGEVGINMFPPDRREDPVLRAWLVQGRRRGASPTVARAIVKTWLDSDVREVLPTVSVPTLVLYHQLGGPIEDWVFRETARYVAAQVAGARYVEVPGGGVFPFLNGSELIDEIQEFLTGVRPSQRLDDRIFATLLFTDIVSSTERAAELGDRRWSDLMDRHDDVVRGELERFRGRWVNPTGDGLLATFDGPARAVRCAHAIASALKPYGIDVRAGLHAGEVEVRGDRVSGIAVNIARRVCDGGSRSEILVSRTIVDLVAGSGLEFEDRGEHELKGVAGRWQLYAVK